MIYLKNGNIAESPKRRIPVGQAINRTDAEIDDSDFVANLLRDVTEEVQAEEAKYSRKLDAILNAKERES
jgi:hypothetical protein